MPNTGKMVGTIGAIAAAIAAFITVLAFTSAQIGSIDTKLSQRVFEVEMSQRVCETAMSEFRADMKWVKRSLERIEKKIDNGSVN